jgi:16S rRNA (guanine(966)-N(2))-methyltransferase RsmD
MRIIGGEFRGRRLVVPGGGGTRPTPDRVREALFAVLGPMTEGARVAELFGGTGSLGLESLSRGAERAVFFETARGALKCLSRNIETLGVADRVTVFRRSAFDAPKVLGGGPPLDLVFCDPPHRLLDDGRTRRRLERVLETLPLDPRALVLIEHRTGALGDFGPVGLTLEELRSWGSTGMAFYRPDASESQ